MQQPYAVAQSALPVSSPAGNESSVSSISWPGIIGGAVAITALSAVFMTLGGALGMASASSPDAGHGMTVATAIWLIVSQWLASAIGGYLTGRLRTRWVAVHTHEVFFRDTAHGFLAWALALIAGLALIGAVASPIMAHMQHTAPTSEATDAHAALFSGLAMLIGAFVASAAAAFGGSQRDEWEDAVRAGTYH